MTDKAALNCLKCPAFCCRMAGYVEVRPADIRRLSKHLGLSVAAFEKKHIVHVTRRGSKRIKAGYESCQFLTADRRCGVYEARPTDCRGYNCWDQPDETVFQFARFTQEPVARLRAREARAEKAEADKATTAKARSGKG
jgi:hypothetical protein